MFVRLPGSTPSTGHTRVLGDEADKTQRIVSSNAGHAPSSDSDARGPARLHSSLASRS
jgi:hypothetical protein